MNKQIRKLVALVLTVIMTVSCIPLSALADIIATGVIHTDSSDGFRPTSERMRTVAPTDEEHYVTYIFKVNGEDVDRQIVKSGKGSVIEPASPSVGYGQRFDGWYIGDSDDKLEFGQVAAVAEDTVTEVNARFFDVYYVYFIGKEGEVVATREATEGNDYKVELPTADEYQPNRARVTGWYNRDTNEPFVNTTVVTEDTYVDAMLTECFWVTFDAMGGTPVP